MAITRFETLLALSLLSAAGLATAANAPTLTSCRAIADEKARLACFDNIPTVPERAPVAVTPPASAPAVAAPPVAAPAVAAPLRPLVALRPPKVERQAQDVQIASARTSYRGELEVTTVADGTWVILGNSKGAKPPAAGATMNVDPGTLGSYFCRVGDRVAKPCVPKEMR